MPKIKKITVAGAQIYPLTIPQAVVDPATGKSILETIDEFIDPSNTLTEEEIETLLNL